MSKTLKYFAEAFAIVFWFIFLIKILIFDLDIYFVQTYFPRFIWILNYKFFVLIIALALLWLILRSKRFFHLLLFVLAYPFFLFFWRIPKILFKTKNWIGVFAAIEISASFFRSLKFNFLTFTLVIISGLLVLVSNAKFILIPSSVILFLFLVLHFVRRFSYGSKRFDFLSKHAGSVMKFWQQIQDSIKSSESQQAANKDKSATEEPSKANRLQILLILNKLCYFLTSKLRNIQKSGVTFVYYFFAILYSILLVVLVFAFQNVSLFKIDPAAFSNKPGDGFIFFVYYSFNTLFTNSIPDFYPRSSFARLLNSVELLFGFLTLSVLIYLFFTILMQKQKREMELSIVALENQGAELEKVISKEYSLTVEQAVEEIEKIKGSMLKIISYLISNIK